MESKGPRVLDPLANLMNIWILKMSRASKQNSGILGLLNTLGIQSYSQLMIGVSNHLLSIVFRFHYHSQEVIGSLGTGKVF